jgi:hypothetical protein
VLEYEIEKRHVSEELTQAQATAFVAMEEPFVATGAAWDRLNSLVRLPAVIAHVALNLDGYLEITSTRPQLVEASPLPGLFRIDATHFGLPLAAAAQVSLQAGFILDPLAPLEEPTLSASPIELSEHARLDITHLVTSLSHYGAQVINWDSGLGRRIVALTAIEQLDAWPALIVTPPSALWAWQRHLDLLGRAFSLGPSAADVELTTYTALSQRQTTPAVLSIVFDSPNSDAALATRPSLRRLASRRDSMRIAIESSWPQDLEDQIAIMELLRPGEFRSDVPLSLRYPPDSTEHAREHISYYLSSRSSSATDTSHANFRRSSARVVDLPQPQVQAIEEAADRLNNAGAHPATALAELLDLVTTGPPSTISPKITLALSIAKDLSGSVAIVTRSKRAVTLMRAILRPQTVTIIEPASAAPLVPSGITIVRVDHVWPDLRSFDHVIVLDYPFSLATLDAAVGPPTEEGPATIVIHANCSLDDRLVVLATRRSLASGVLDATAPPSLEEMAFLFEPSPV